jgi:hypothetical protein
MPFIGNKPSAVPLTSADIADGIITSAKIVDGTIVNADINASAAIASTKLSGVGANAGEVIQVVTNKLTSSFSTSSQNVFVTTSQTLSITPSSASNKILVMFNAGSITTVAANTAMDVQVRRGGTVVCFGGYYTATVGGNQTVPFGVIHTLDSPNTTSSITYEVFAAEGGIPGTVSLNADRVLTLMEVKG